MSVYPAQALERNGIPAIRQQASSTNSISNSETTNNNNHILLTEESINGENYTTTTISIGALLTAFDGIAMFYFGNTLLGIIVFLF